MEPDTVTALPDLVNAVTWLATNWGGMANLIAQIIAVATVIVKLTPTLKDDNYFLPIIKVLGKWFALNRGSGRPS